MGVTIYITNEVTGESTLYQHTEKSGKCIIVPTYRMIVKNDTGYRYDFHVTRDTYQGLRGGIQERYDTNDECPPNIPGIPYEGYILGKKYKRFGIGISEPSIKDEYRGHHLCGIGSTYRKYIQIHSGPGASEGCFLLIGDDTVASIFKEKINTLCTYSKEKNITVHVFNRYNTVAFI